MAPRGQLWPKLFCDQMILWAMGTCKEEILNSLIVSKLKEKIMPFGKNKEKKFVFAIYVLFTFSNKQANIPHFKGKKKSLYSERL